MGIALLYFSDEVREIVVDYTDCKQMNTGLLCADVIKSGKVKSCECEENFTLTQDFLVGGRVFGSLRKWISMGICIDCRARCTCTMA